MFRFRAFHRLILALCLAGAIAFPASAREETPAVQPQALVAFDSDEGMARLLRSRSKSDFAALAKHGFNDDDVWDIASIASFFALSNRMANVTRMRPNDEFYTLGR